MAAATACFEPARHRLLAGRGDDRHLVVLGVEADLGSEMSLSTTASRPLRSSLLPGALSAALAVLGGEADQRLSARRDADSAASTSAVGSSSTLQPVAARLPIFRLRGSAGRKSATAAAISRTSAAGNPPARRRRARPRSPPATDPHTGRHASATFAATSVTSAPRRAASAASATPIRPDERLPT